MTIGNYIIDNYAVIGASSAGLVTLFVCDFSFHGLKLPTPGTSDYKYFCQYEI